MKHVSAGHAYEMAVPEAKIPENRRSQLLFGSSGVTGVSYTPALAKHEKREAFRGEYFCFFVYPSRGVESNPRNPGNPFAGTALAGGVMR